LGSFCKLLEYIFHGTSYVFSVTINGSGYSLGNLFTNSSGHPASKETKRLTEGCRTAKYVERLRHRVWRK
jgi:hypothetical protein